MPILEPARIVERATAVLNQLRRHPAWTVSLAQAAITSPPLFVTSIAPPPQSRIPSRPALPDYYIVSLQRGAGTSARFAHRADTGDFLEAEGVRKPGAFLAPYIDPEQVVRSHGPSLATPTPGGAPAPVSRALVWRPCRQSTSPFLPFWRVAVEGRTLYVRADGIMFEELTTAGRG
jgi:hypothetical protein